MPTRITAAEARKLGIVRPKKLMPRLSKEEKAALEETKRQTIRMLCKANGLPEPEFEFEFCPGRKWRFDWAFSVPGQYVYVEVQGSLFTGGRHTRGAALLKEYEKINAASERGWVPVFVTPQQVESGEVFTILKRVLG